MQKFSFLFLFFSLAAIFHQPLDGQPVISGRIVDEETKDPLVFVNIVYNKKGTGTTSGLDGQFQIEASELPGFLKLSYVGYEPVTFYTSELDLSSPLVLTMKRTSYRLEEVRIVPGVNPAHRIINKAVANRTFNNPEMLSSFRYTSYNKLFFTLIPDSLMTGTALPGSPDVSVRFTFPAGAEAEEEGQLPGAEKPGVAEVEAEKPDTAEKEFWEKQHLFLMESVSERQYMRSGRDNERVIASRVSGFRDPSFSLIATQIQSFSFYEDFISIFDKKYLNPISRGSTSRYSFVLEDSMLTQQNDTLFVISFRPYQGRNFDGLKGVVYINSQGYAVQNVIAEPYKPQGFFTVRIQQNYSFVDNKQWFPDQLNTEIILAGGNVSENGDNYTLMGIGNSYISGIEIEPELSRRSFSHVDLVIDPNAHSKGEEFWDDFRIAPLDEKERETYHVLDSIGKEAGFDRVLKIFETLAVGYIPWGVFNIDYTSLLDCNYFEGVRPGIRAITNERLSSIFSLGGHAAWGTKDKRLKYGGEAAVNIYRPGELKMDFSYLNDVKETGRHGFLQAYSPFSSENYRRFMVGRMDYTEKYETSLSARLGYLKSRLYMSASSVTPGDSYLFLNEGTEAGSFRFSEAGAQFRFAYGEKFMQTPRGNLISMGTDYPVLWFNYGRGVDMFDGEYLYRRMEARVQQSFITKSLGKTTLTVEGGKVHGEVPLQRLYSGNGSYRNLSLEAANSFATMRMGEFFSGEFVSLFFRHNFESLLFRKGNFRPEIVFISNAGFGKLRDKDNHLNLNVKAPEKGYYESGILINNLYRHLFAGYGIGVFYRYGPHSLSETADNFAFKLTFSMNL